MKRFLRLPGQTRLLAAMTLVLGFSTPRVDADIVINEVLASNRATNLDQFHSSSDWVEILNTGAEPLDLTGYWLGDDPKSPQKWQFPVLTLVPGERRLVWCSGKDLAFPDADFIEARKSKVIFTPSYITTEAAWRYLTDAPGTPGPPIDWFQPEFDDTTWATGKPPFGIGDHRPPAVPAELRTVTPPGNNVVLLRTSFDVATPIRIPTLVWRAYYDDSFIVYLNGVRVLDVAHDRSDPDFNSVGTSSHNPRRPIHFDFSPHRELLQEGKNILAVALLNTTGDDIFLQPELGEVEPLLHASFKLSSGGEGVFLSDPDGNPVDSIVFPDQATDRSYGRSPDGNGEFLFMLEPTPGTENTDLVSTSFLSNDIAFTPESGVFEDQVSVVLSTSLPFDSIEIRFTTDGQAPVAQSAAYDQPILLTDDTAIRSAAFLGRDRVSRIVTKSFFVSDLARGLHLPIISVAMAPEHFVDVHVHGGKGIRSERPAHMQIFDAQGVPVVATSFGLRLHGGGGRRGEIDTKKAYRAYFRSIYGDSRLKYPLIPDTDNSIFDRLVLRSNSNDAFRSGSSATLIRDQLVRDLHAEMGALVSHGSWHNLFVNGEYRGVYNVVERMDQNFFESYFPEEEKTWDVIRPWTFLLRLRFYQTVLNGSSDVWREMMAFMLRGGLEKKELYEQALEMVDAEALISYMIVNIWAQNDDWPHHNWYAARPQGKHGRWFFLSWDTETSIGADHTGDTFARVSGKEHGRTSAPAIVFGALLRNPNYQELFLEAFDRYLAGVLDPDNVLAHIDRLAGLIGPDIPEEARITGGSVQSWQLAVSEMKQFVTRRNAVIRDHVMSSKTFSVPIVLGVHPTSVVQLGPTDVIVKTRNLTQPAQVFFNDIPAKKVVPEDNGDLLVTLPFDIRLKGTPTIRLVSDDREVTASNLITVSFPHAKISTIDPPVGSPSGGEVVRIRGSNLTASARVEFGTREAPSVHLVDGGDALVVVTPPGEGVVKVRVINTEPEDLEPLNTISFTYRPGAKTGFLRGDADRSGLVTISDAVAILRHVTGLAGEPPCESALDVNDSEAVDISDAIFLINFLFRLHAPQPPAPFPNCGRESTGDSDLTCMAPVACR